MIALLQRVSEARVTVAGRVVAEIGRGVLAFICAERGDSEASAVRLVERVLALRVFQDRPDIRVSNAGIPAEFVPISGVEMI